MLAAVDDARSWRHGVENAVIKVMQKLASVLGVNDGIGAVYALGIMTESAEIPEREKNDIGIFFENTGENLASALTGYLRALAVRRIGGSMRVLFGVGVFLGIEHKAFHIALFGDPRGNRHILRVVGPSLVVVPVKTRITIFRRHPKEEKAFLQMWFFGDLAQNGNLILYGIASPSHGAAHHLRKSRRYNAAALSGNDDVIQRESHAVKIRRMLGEFIGMPENIARRRLHHIEKKSDVLFI